MLPLYSEMRSGQYDSQSLVALETTNNLPILLFSLVLLLPQLSLQARRLRDAGLHPGWAVLFLMPWIPVINIFSLFGNMALLIMSALPSKDN